jgi:hypothetical protein
LLATGKRGHLVQSSRQLKGHARQSNSQLAPDLLEVFQKMWRDMKRQEIDNINHVKQMIAEEIKNGCF